MTTASSSLLHTEMVPHYPIKERGQLYRAEMVNAILEDRKSQTRRLVDKRGFLPFTGCYFERDFPTVTEMVKAGNAWKGRVGEFKTCMGEWRCPYGVPGERLWVRETWRVTGRDRAGQWEQCIEYRADHSCDAKFRDAEHWKLAKAWADARKTNGWGTPIHMPRWASRILLEITSIGCERLQDITVEDVYAEGIQIPVSAKDGRVIIQVSGKIKPADYVPNGFFAADRKWSKADQDLFVKSHYAALWDTINGVGSWKSNPFVWRIAFKRIT